MSSGGQGSLHRSRAAVGDCKQHATWPLGCACAVPIPSTSRAGHQNQPRTRLRHVRLIIQIAAATLGGSYSRDVRQLRCAAGYSGPQFGRRNNAAGVVLKSSARLCAASARGRCPAVIAPARGPFFKCGTMGACRSSSRPARFFLAPSPKRAVCPVRVPRAGLFSLRS